MGKVADLWLFGKKKGQWYRFSRKSFIKRKMNAGEDISYVSTDNPKHAMIFEDDPGFEEKRRFRDVLRNDSR